MEQELTNKQLDIAHTEIRVWHSKKERVNTCDFLVFSSPDKQVYWYFLWLKLKPCSKRVETLCKLYTEAECHICKTLKPHIENCMKTTYQMVKLCLKMLKLFLNIISSFRIWCQQHVPKVWTASCLPLCCIYWQYIQVVSPLLFKNC